jgi:hypothetical protein
VKLGKRGKLGSWEKEVSENDIAWLHGCMDAWMHGCMDSIRLVTFFIFLSSYLPSFGPVKHPQKLFKELPKNIFTFFT